MKKVQESIDEADSNRIGINEFYNHLKQKNNIIEYNKMPLKVNSKVDLSVRKESKAN